MERKRRPTDAVSCGPLTPYGPSGTHMTLHTSYYTETK